MCSHVKKDGFLVSSSLRKDRDEDYAEQGPEDLIYNTEVGPASDL